MASLVGKRIARIARRGSLPAAVRAVRREAWLRSERAKLDAGLRDASRPVLVGPFAGEVGFELLFWRPWVRHLLRSNGVDPDRATVVSRGGAGVWYRDVAAHAKDVLEVATPDELRIGIERRVDRIGQRKQVDVDAFDRELLSRVGVPENGVVVHPFHLYWWGMRFVWEGLEQPEAALERGDYDQLEREPDAIVGIELPERFVAVKLYSNDTIPVTRETQAASARVVAELAREHEVVLLETGLAVDDHVNLDAGGTNVHSVAGLLDAPRNLLQQAEIVARADVLVSTYGGFSYLGPFLGVPAVAVHSVLEWNPLHEVMLRTARPDAPYVRVPLDDSRAVATEVERLR
jgi:hypothetical protein